MTFLFYKNKPTKIFNFNDEEIGTVTRTESKSIGAFNQRRYIWFKINKENWYGFVTNNDYIIKNPKIIKTEQGE